VKAILLFLTLLFSVGCSAQIRNNMAQTAFVGAGAAVGSLGGPIGAIGGAMIGDVAADAFMPDPEPEQEITVVYVDPTSQNPVIYTNTSAPRTDTFNEKIG
jgi:hypothetical protein